MADKTQYLGLKKAESSDYYSVEFHNSNNEIIDREVAKKADRTWVQEGMAKVNQDLADKALLENPSLLGNVKIKSDEQWSYIRFGNRAELTSGEIIVGNVDRTLRLRAFPDKADLKKCADMVFDGYTLVPNVFNMPIPSLGAAGGKWDTLYINSPVIHTSDEREKIEIAPISTANAFIAALNPVQYKMANGSSGRTHYGLIAQQVKAAMDYVGLSDMDFAGYIASPAANGSGDCAYGLRYSEFIAPLIAVVQQLQQRVQILENKMVGEAPTNKQ